ncbi:MAG TPA: metal-sensitive transcriptional regulator [Chloroflexota bacterium]|nr:metal-sensitive transcriptional regulator [Chloroflexota bacterium]
MDTAEKAIRARLRRAAGQLDGIVRMLEDGRNCEEILIQILAVRTALDRAAAEIVAARLDECLATMPRTEARRQAGRAVRLLARLG